jgi:hypothetical protein
MSELSLAEFIGVKPTHLRELRMFKLRNYTIYGMFFRQRLAGIAIKKRDFYRNPNKFTIVPLPLSSEEYPRRANLADTLGVKSGSCDVSDRVYGCIVMSY